MNAIETHALTRRFGPRTAVDGLDLPSSRASCLPCWA